MLNPSARTHGRASQELDDLSLARCPVPDDDVVSGIYLSLEEVIKRDRAVHDVRLGQPCCALKALKLLGHLRDERNGNALARQSLALVFSPSGLAVRSGAISRSSPPRRAWCPRISELPSPPCWSPLFAQRYAPVVNRADLTSGRSAPSCAVHSFILASSLHDRNSRTASTTCF